MRECHIVCKVPGPASYCISGKVWRDKILDPKRDSELSCPVAGAVRSRGHQSQSVYV